MLTGGYTQVLYHLCMHLYQRLDSARHLAAGSASYFRVFTSTLEPDQSSTLEPDHMNKNPCTLTHAPMACSPALFVYMYMTKYTLCVQKNSISSATSGVLRRPGHHLAKGKVSDKIYWIDCIQLVQRLDGT